MEPSWGRAGRGEAASPGIALTFLPRNASGISKQVNRGAARRNYCSGFVKFANLFGGGVSGVRNEHSTCCNCSRARHPVPQGSGCAGDTASLFPGDTIFPHLLHLSGSKEKIFECPISSEIRKKKEGGKGEKRILLH